MAEWSVNLRHAIKATKEKLGRLVRPVSRRLRLRPKRFEMLHGSAFEVWLYV